ncbi:polycystic kidney disease 2-like 2 protein [Zootermopsis nevadensis]|uniref:polycystic kidney disease 2-like 2 protein n=1 Tax=Zootermopsis nevadensis TaxID=136037 RepID=UPI000B8E8F74|nr:polycystic kidney disease 2-like 2 protein [Zootermopsis nevadensis]
MQWISNEWTSRLLFENSQTRGIYTSYYRETVKFHRLETAYDYFVAVCECMFVAFIFFYTIEEIVDIVVLKRICIQSVWNGFDLIILMIGYFVIWMRISSYVIIEPQIIQHISDEKLANFYSFHYYQDFYDDATLLLFLVTCLTIIKYVCIIDNNFEFVNPLLRNWKEITAISVVIIVIYVTCIHMSYTNYCCKGE